MTTSNERAEGAEGASPRHAGESLTKIQASYSGLWVALKDGEVVEARPTPYELVAALHSKAIIDTTIIRVPSPDEPELVGLG